MRWFNARTADGVSIEAGETISASPFTFLYNKITVLNSSSEALMLECASQGPAYARGYGPGPLFSRECRGKGGLSPR